MNKLLLITVLLVAATTKLLAQDGAIEIKRQASFGTVKNDETKSENHQFEIVANENVAVNLKFDLKTNDNVNVLVTDKKGKVVFSKEFQKSGENKINFTMEEDEKYIVLLAGNKQSNLIVKVSGNKEQG